MVTENYLTQPIQWIENEVYYAKGSNNYTFKTNLNGGYKGYMCNLGSYSTEHDSNFQWESWEVRLATPQEKQWYLACEKAGKFVSKPEYFPLEQIIIW